MTNVVQFPTQETKVSDEALLSPAHMLAGAKSLWQVGALSSDAFFIAAQVAYLLVVADRPVVQMTWVEGMGRTVFHGDALIAGPIQCQLKTDFGLALLELHSCVGLVNGLDRKFFNTAGNPRQHFTVPHPMRKPVFWNENTPIYFRLDNFEAVAYQEFIKRQINSKLTDCKILRFVKG